jgi:hypothetical protein
MDEALNRFITTPVGNHRAIKGPALEASTSRRREQHAGQSINLLIETWVLGALLEFAERHSGARTLKPGEKSRINSWGIILVTAALESPPVGRFGFASTVRSRLRPSNQARSPQINHPHQQSRYH